MLNKSIFVIVFVLMVTIVIIKNSFVNAFFGEKASQKTEQQAVKLLPGKDITSVVQIIAEAVKSRDISTLEDYVTEVPENYIQKSVESMRRESGTDIETFKKQMTRHPDTIANNPYPSFANKKDQVDFAIPLLNTISNEKNKSVKIASIKHYDNEAIALVIFVQPNLPDEIYEILLYRVNNEWKFFRFSYEHTNSDLYAEEDVEIPMEVREQTKSYYFLK